MIVCFFFVKFQSIQFKSIGEIGGIEVLYAFGKYVFERIESMDRNSNCIQRFYRRKIEVGLTGLLMSPNRRHSCRWFSTELGTHTTHRRSLDLFLQFTTNTINQSRWRTIWSNRVRLCVVRNWLRVTI